MSINWKEYLPTIRFCSGWIGIVVPLLLIVAGVYRYKSDRKWPDLSFVLPWYEPNIGLIPLAVGVAAFCGLIWSSISVYLDPKTKSLIIGVLIAWTFLPPIWFSVERNWLFPTFRQNEEPNTESRFKEAQGSMGAMWAAFAGFMFCVWTVANEPPASVSVIENGQNAPVEETKKGRR